MTERHEEWLARAEDDLRFANVGLKEGFYAQVCFLSQQVIEKCLKGSLVALGRTYPKSHNLRELALKLPELSLNKYKEQLAIIDGYYVPLRYPDAVAGSTVSGPPTKDEAKRALALARKIFNTVSSFVA